MNLNWRVTGIVAAGSAALTILIAGIAGRAFGVVVVRALIVSVLSVGIATGLQILIMRFLPELAQFGRSEAPAAGSSLNVVVGDDEAPVQSAPREESIPAEDWQGDDGGIVEEVEETRAVEHNEQADIVDVGAGMDDLPDVAGLESSFRDLSAEPGDEESDGGSPTTSSGSSGGAGADGQDPAEIARALQTMMKKE